MSSALHYQVSVMVVMCSLFLPQGISWYKLLALASLQLHANVWDAIPPAPLSRGTSTSLRRELGMLSAPRHHLCCCIISSPWDIYGFLTSIFSITVPLRLSCWLGDTICKMLSLLQPKFCSMFHSFVAHWPFCILHPLLVPGCGSSAPTAALGGWGPF